MSKVRKLISIVFLVINDIAALLVSFLIAYYLRSVLLLPVIPRFEYIEPLPLMTHIRLGFFWGGLIIVCVLAYEKLYFRRLSFWEETQQLIKGVTISFVLILALVFVLRQYIFFSRPVIVFAWMLSLVFFPIFRLGTKKALVKARLWKKRILILGTGNTALQVSEGMKQNPVLGYEIAGFLTDEEQKIGQSFGDFKIIGKLSHVERLSQDLGVKDFIIALPSSSQEELINIIGYCDKFAESIRIVPNIGSLFTLGVAVENLGDVLSLSLSRNLDKPWNKLLKIFFEYVLITVFLLLLLPVFLCISLAIKINSKGPVFFVQERLGKKGKIFKIYKFRSMYEDNEDRLAEFLESNPEAKAEWDKYRKIKEGDPRVTKVGRFIRKYSLDEIPQLINGFKGNMSLVGPRPYLPQERGEMGKSQSIILRARPGLTGIWQVRGRSLLSFKERLVLDEYYIRNWSLWFDIVILFKTARALAKQEGAF